MKKLILTLFLGMFILLTYAQRVNPDGKNWKHTGTHEYTQPLTIEGETLSGAKIEDYDEIVAATGDTATLESIAVIKSDSTLQKPGHFASRYDFKNEPTNQEFYKMAKAGGATIKPLMPTYPLVNVGAGSLTDGRLYLMRFYTSDSTTITGFQVLQTTAASQTGDAYNGIYLYRYSNDSIIKIGNTTNAINFWSTTINTIMLKALSAPVTIAPGFYAIGMIYNSAAGTAPQMESTYVSLLSRMTYPNVWPGFCHINSVTTPANSYKYGDSINAVGTAPFILLTY